MVTLAFVGLIIGFVLLDLLVIRKIEKSGPFAGASTEGGHPPASAELRMPRGYFFHPGHVWARIQPDGRVLVGMDDFARAALGGVAAVRLPSPGQVVKEGQATFRVAGGDKELAQKHGKPGDWVRRVTEGELELAFVAPLSGKVTAVNTTAAADPSIIDEQPYGAGWLVAIEPEPGPCRELATLVIAGAAADWMRRELDRLRGFIDEHRPGASIQGLLGGASGEVWSAFQDGFLDRSTGKEAEA